MKEYSIGYDIGSEFVHGAVLDESANVLYVSRPVLHQGDVENALKEVGDEISFRGFEEKNSRVSFSGSGGKTLSEIIGGDYFFESIAIPQGAHLIDNGARYVFHIGSEKNYFFEKEEIGGGSVYVLDHGSGTKCGGGAGVLLTKQARRLFEGSVSGSAQEVFERMHSLAYEEAMRHDKIIDVGGRCGVVIQSDMIHLQNKGEALSNILRALYERVALNYVSNVLGNRTLDKEERAVFSGGVSFNSYIRESLEKILGLEVVRPKYAESIGAIGAAFLGMKKGEGRKVFFGDVGKVRERQKSEVMCVEPLGNYVDRVRVYSEEDFEKVGDLKVFQNGGGRIYAALGVDGGSTTTKAMLLNLDSLKPVAEICVDTHGRPVQAAQNIFRQIKDYFGDGLSVESVVYTGSSGEFYRKIFSSVDSRDMVVDEISCHARGVKHFDERVDTIFELGGQDAKFTRFGKNGVVKKAKMNLSCMAGTGQTMKNLIDMLGLDFDSFEKKSLEAKRVPVVDDTCGVFTEMGVLRLVELGFPIEEISAAIAYGFIGGYVNKFIGNENFGKVVSAQGGPFKSKACLAALAHHTKLDEINAFPHRQLFGAYGAALEAADILKNGV